MRYGNVLLHAEWLPHAPNDTIGWRLRPLNVDISLGEIEIASSPSSESFRAVLTHVGRHYLGGILNGYALLMLCQKEKAHRCHLFLSNTPETGFWVRLCVED